MPPVIDVEVSGVNPTIVGGGAGTHTTLTVTIVSLGASESVYGVTFVHGDGNSDFHSVSLLAGQSTSTSFTYAAPGTYQPSVLVWYNPGSTSVSQTSNNGNNTPIVVYPFNASLTFTVVPTSGVAPLTVTAHLTPELWAAPLVNAVIRWGPTDSEYTLIDLSSWISGEVQATHTYTFPDTYVLEADVNYAAVTGIDDFGRELISDLIDVVVTTNLPNLAGAPGDINAYFSPGRP